MIRTAHSVLFVCVLSAVLTATFAKASETATAHHTVGVSNGHFVLDGKPVQILSGEMHYPRIPRPYWRDRGTFNLTTVGDTYLDVSALGKGLIWVNGHAVGRVWNIGPQHSDYVPGCWLNKGRNSVTVFDLEDESGSGISGKTHHVYAPQPQN